MRRKFKVILYEKMKENPKIWVITPDLGYGFFKEIKKNFPDRFVQCKATENLAMGIAVGLAENNLIPVIYSITPFLLSTPHSFIRNYINHEKVPVKLLGGGRTNDYYHDGFSHYAGDDLDIIYAFENIKCFWPHDEKALEIETDKWLNHYGPAYLNLKR